MPELTIRQQLEDNVTSLLGLMLGLIAIAMGFFSLFIDSALWTWIVNLLGLGASALGTLGFMRKNNRFICTFAIATALAAISMQYSWIALIVVVLLTALSLSF